jgi:cytochrome P450
MVGFVDFGCVKVVPERLRRNFAFATLLTEFLPLAADRRSHAGDDLLSFIASDPDLLLDDVVITAILIAVAGHETTANLLGRR